MTPARTLPDRELPGTASGGSRLTGSQPAIVQQPLVSKAADPSDPAFAGAFRAVAGTDCIPFLSGGGFRC
jgi:hypothetical protein